jgi:CheY-like chemotaxis protein
MSGPAALTVLVLDDEAGVRNSLRRFLGIYGYNAVEAESIEQANDVLAREHVDAVILDVRLPGERTGLDVLGTLRTQASLGTIPVLVLTGGTLTEQEEAFVAARRGHVFLKPEGLDTLLQFLDQLTGRDRAH